MTNRGQLALAKREGNRTVALLENWDSKRNTHSISMLFGQSDVLLPVMGIPLD